MKFLTNEVKIALVAITGIVVLFIGLHFLKGLRLFSSATSYYVQFDNVSGLSASSPVYANGYRVGVVEAIHYDYSCPSKIIATVGLDKQMKVPSGTTAEIVSDLLGNVKLELKFPESQTGILSEGDTITGCLEQGALAKAAEMIPQVQQMLPKLDSILTSISVLVADPAIASTLHNVDQITTTLTTTTRQLNQLTATLNGRMPHLVQQADSIMDNTRKLTGNLSELDLAATMQKVDATLANVQQITATLNSNEGSLGLLMRDPQLYNHITATMRDVDSLLVDFKAHPRRYINFSVFGKKDK